MAFPSSSPVKVLVTLHTMLEIDLTDTREGAWLREGPKQELRALGEGWNLRAAGQRKQGAKEEEKKTEGQLAFSSSVSALASSAVAFCPSTGSFKWETRIKPLSLMSLLLRFRDAWPILQLLREPFHSKSSHRGPLQPGLHSPCSVLYPGAHATEPWTQSLSVNTRVLAQIHHWHVVLRQPLGESCWKHQDWVRCPLGSFAALRC